MFVFHHQHIVRLIRYINRCTANRCLSWHFINDGGGFCPEKMMKRRSVPLFILITLLCSVHGSVTVNLYEADGITPFDGREIMVGTELSIVVNSDSTDYWS